MPIRGVLATGGGQLILLTVLTANVVIPDVGLRHLFRQLSGRSTLPMTIALTVAHLVVHDGLLLTTTLSPSIVSLGPKAVIASVALTTGSANTIVRSGWCWRMVGAARILGPLWLLATPVLFIL